MSFGQRSVSGISFLPVRDYTDDLSTPDLVVFAFFETLACGRRFDPGTSLHVTRRRR